MQCFCFEGKWVCGSCVTEGTADVSVEVEDTQEEEQVAGNAVIFMIFPLGQCEQNVSLCSLQMIGQNFIMNSHFLSFI